LLDLLAADCEQGQGASGPSSTPPPGQQIQGTAVAEDTGGHLIRFNWRSVPAA
jgi:hypothetical protein